MGIGQNCYARGCTLGSVSLTRGCDRNRRWAWKSIWSKVVSGAIDLANREIAARDTVHCPSDRCAGTAADCGRKLLRLEYLYLGYGRRNGHTNLSRDSEGGAARLRSVLRGCRRDRCCARRGGTEDPCAAYTPDA